jgi:hypothetical protein
LAGLHFLGKNRGPWTMKQQPCSTHCGSWLVYAWQKLEHGMHPCFPLYTWNPLQGFP